MDNLKLMKKEEKFWLSLAIDITMNQSDREQPLKVIKYLTLNLRSLKTKLNQWKSTAGNRNTRKNKADSTTLPLLGENNSND